MNLLQAIGAFLRDTPRFDLIDMDIDGLEAVAESLGLPEREDEWECTSMIQYFWDMHRNKVLAFAMGVHARLGSQSCVLMLGDALSMVFAMLFDKPSSMFVMCNM